MFSNFSDEAQRAVGLAQWEARRLNSSRVGTEHLLLGILRAGDSTAMKALMSLGLEPDRLCLAVERLVGPGGGPVPGVMPFSPRAGQVLTVLAPDESRVMGEAEVGPEHLLLGLVREGEGVAAVVLDEAGVDLPKARAAVRTALEPAPQMRSGPLDWGRRPEDSPAGPGAEDRWATDLERAVRVVKRAREEMLSLHAPELKLVHFLMALLSDPEGADLDDLLRSRGVTLEWLRDHYRPR